MRPTVPLFVRNSINVPSRSVTSDIPWPCDAHYQGHPSGDQRRLDWAQRSERRDCRRAPLRLACWACPPGGDLSNRDRHFRAGYAVAPGDWVLVRYPGQGDRRRPSDSKIRFRAAASTAPCTRTRTPPGNCTSMLPPGLSGGLDAAATLVAGTSVGVSTLTGSNVALCILRPSDN